MSAVEIVYRLRDNPNSVQFLLDKEPIDFTSVTRVTMKLEDTDAIIDTDIDADLIDWSRGEGEVVFNLNFVTVTDEERLGVLFVVYDALHPNGQVLIHPTQRLLFFQFYDA